MTKKRYQIVGRKAPLWPHQLHGFAMHGRRAGGDLTHCRKDLGIPTRVLIGDRKWKEDALQRIAEMRQANFVHELEKLRARHRRKQIAERLREGPKDPWFESDHGPLREIILTANQAFFDSDPTGALEARFEQLALGFLRETFGADLIHARADHDEAAYHIHAVVMPETRTTDGREMLQPSKHAVIKHYEQFQTEIGTRFTEIGLVRGREWAREAREARARGELGAEIPRHRRTADWRKAEELRLEAERLELERCNREQSEKAIADATQQAQRQRDLDAQAAEQDAFAATAEALEASFITPEDPKTFRGASTNPHAEGILARIQAATSGYHRFIGLMKPAWARMQQIADQAASEAIRKDRLEIEAAWTNLEKIARAILPSLEPIGKPRDSVARAISWWKIKKARDESRNKNKGAEGIMP